MEKATKAKRPKTPDSKVSSWCVQNLGIAGQPNRVTASSLRQLRTLNVVPFTGDRGDRNQYPNEINALLRESPTLRAIVKSKADYTVGDELIISGGKFEAGDKLNLKGQTFRDIFEGLSFNFHGHNSAWLQLVKSGETIAPFVINPSQVRYKQLDKDEEEYSAVLIHEDWLKPKKDEITEIALYKEGTPWTKVGKNMVSMVHIKAEDSDLEPYSVPDWIGAQSFAKIEYLIGLFNYSALENGMFSGGVLSIVQRAGSGKENEETADDYRDKMFGTENGNAGKLLIQLVQDLDEKMVDFVPFNDIKEGHFKELAHLSTTKIVTACRWYSSLAGLETAGKLGGSNELLQQFRIAVKSAARSRNKIIDSIRSTWFEAIGAEKTEIEAINESPAPSDGWQGSQLSAAADVVARITSNELTSEQGSKLLQIGFGVSEEDANIITGNGS